MSAGHCDEIATYDGECEYGVMLVEECAWMSIDDWCSYCVPWLWTKHDTPRCAPGREMVSRTAAGGEHG